MIQTLKVTLPCKNTIVEFNFFSTQRVTKSGEGRKGTEKSI